MSKKTEKKEKEPRAEIEGMKFHRETKDDPQAGKLYINYLVEHNKIVKGKLITDARGEPVKVLRRVSPDEFIRLHLKWVGKAPAFKELLQAKGVTENHHEAVRKQIELEKAKVGRANKDNVGPALVIGNMPEPLNKKNPKQAVKAPY